MNGSTSSGIFHAPFLETDLFWFPVKNSTGPIIHAGDQTNSLANFTSESDGPISSSLKVSWHFFWKIGGWWNVTLSPIIMEVENDNFGDSTHLPGPCFPLPWFCEEGYQPYPSSQSAWFSEKWDVSNMGERVPRIYRLIDIPSNLYIQRGWLM